MSLIYKAVQSTIENKSGDKTWHPALVKVGKTVTTHEVGEKIALMSSLNPGDVHNVFRCLPIVFWGLLLDGKSVKIEGWGTFTLKIRSRGKGVLTAKEVNPGQITDLHCQFTPEYSRMGNTITRSHTVGVEFVHVDRLNTGKEGTNEGSGNGDDDDYVDPNA